MENILLAFPGQRSESVVGALLGTRKATADVVNAQEAALLLEFVGLTGKGNACASELSYGEQKLLTLACCLATGGEFLLLDEPVAGVHPEMINDILARLVSLRDQGKTIVLIEHNLEAVRAVADRVVLMSEGVVLAEGVKAEVFDRPEIMEAYFD